MSYGRSIRLFLIEGEPTGRWKCELSNWTGLAFKIPRTMIPQCSDRPELGFTGLYFLIGKDEGTDHVYVGESENILKRIIQHISTDEWQDWTECVVFVSKDDGLNKAQAKHLESKLHDIMVSCDRCDVVNMNKLTCSSLSEADEAEMEEYLSNLKLLMGALGYRFLEPPITTEARKGIEFVMMGSKQGYDARAIVVPDGIVVLKGSRVSKTISNSVENKGYGRLRHRLMDDGTISDGIFMKDHHFDSYSAASTVVSGNNTNGWLAWRTEGGRMLDEVIGEMQNNPSDVQD